MEMFNYVMVLASVIIGLGITHLLTGVAGMVQHPERDKIYWVHLLWVGRDLPARDLLVVVRIRFSTVAQWTFSLYFFVLAYALLIYLWCALLIPRDLAGYDGYKDYFYSRRSWFFGVGLAAVFADFADTLLKGFDHFASLGWLYVALPGDVDDPVRDWVAHPQRALPRHVRPDSRHLAADLPGYELRHGAARARRRG